MQQGLVTTEPPNQYYPLFWAIFWICHFEKKSIISLLNVRKKNTFIKLVSTFFTASSRTDDQTFIIPRMGKKCLNFISPICRCVELDWGSFGQIPQWMAVKAAALKFVQELLQYGKSQLPVQFHAWLLENFLSVPLCQMQGKEKRKT